VANIINDLTQSYGPEITQHEYIGCEKQNDKEQPSHVCLTVGIGRSRKNQCAFRTEDDFWRSRYGPVVLKFSVHCNDPLCFSRTSVKNSLNTIVYSCSSAHHILMNPFLSSWDLVHVYLMVMREGSLSSAARKLGTSQPTVRRQIEALETELGVPLFTRATSGLIPTERGEALRVQAEAAEATMGAFRRSASGPAISDTGTVRVSCSEVYGVEIMPRLLAGLMKRHPNLEIELVLSNRNDDLLKREADIAVRMVAPQQVALIAKKVAPVELGFSPVQGF
jgi:hypothetical protein